MATIRTAKIRHYATIDGLTVQFTVDRKQAPQIADLLAKQVNGDLEISIGKPKKKRSLTANAYLWVLCDEIAKAVGVDKENIYRALIRRVGVFDYVLVKEQVAERFQDNWGGNGVGWFAEEVFYHDPDKRQFACYYGTSVYNSVQMARVIDEAVAEAKALNVETLPPEELKEIKRKWKRDL